MNKTLIGLVLIALLIGLGGGYGLGYVIYQPQLQNLQKGLDDLDDEFQGKLDTLTGKLTNLNLSVVVLSNGLNAVNSTLRNTQSSVTSLQNQLTSLDSEIAGLNSTLNNVQSLVTSIQNQLSSLQNQLSSLNSRLENLNATVRQIENRSWHQVYSVSASSNVTSGMFQLKGKEFRVMWSADGQSSLSWLSIVLRFSNGTLYSYYGSSGIWTATNVEEDLVQSGQYYLQILSYQTDYDLILWDYY